MTSLRSPGEHIVFRDVYRSRVRAVVPMIVVEHTADRVVLFLKLGTPFLLTADKDGNFTKDVEHFDHLMEVNWKGGEQLLIVPTEASHAVIVRWDDTPERRLVEWYINLQAPLKPTALGFDTVDHALDVVIAADLSTATWKDEDQLAALVRTGYFSVADAAEIRDEGERVIADAVAKASPFDEGWENWLPNPEWPIPTLPDGCQTS